MSTIAARCPKCKSVFRLKDASLAGKKIKCRKCQAPFVVQPIKSSGGGGARRKTSSSVDPYGREISFSKTGELPVSGRKIKKIQKVAETVEPEEGDDTEEFGQPTSAPIRRKPRKKVKAKAADTGKKKKKSQTTTQQKIIAVVGGVFLLTTIIVGAVFGPTIAKRISEAGKLEPPKNYVLYDPDDSGVKFEYPEGWETSHGGGTGGQPKWARIKHDNISISIKENQAASALGEAAQAMANNDPNENDPELQPVHGAHMQRQMMLMRSDEGYQETGVEIFESGLGDSRLSKFEEKGTFSTTVGFRATLMAGRFTFFVKCSCSPAQFESAAPIFRRILKSIGLGKRI
ncbi:hypothetical protein Pan258_20780 [Symmachiella dynata]|nr:hypothetical protein Pan258_20780 [Symmachiella dynata]